MPDAAPNAAVGIEVEVIMPDMEKTDDAGVAAPYFNVVAEAKVLLPEVGTMDDALGKMNDARVVTLNADADDRAGGGQRQRLAKRQREACRTWNQRFVSSGSRLQAS